MNEKIKTGFLYGVGLLIPLLGGQYIFQNIPSVTFMVSHMYASETAESDEPSAGHGDITIVERSEPKFELGPHAIKRMGKVVLITGEIRNLGDEKLVRPEIDADLFDEKGEFVFKCSTEYVNDILAHKKSYFMVECGCCGSSGVPDFASTKLNVTFPRF